MSEKPLFDEIKEKLIAQNRDDEDIKQIINNIPLEKIGKPEYIEKCVEWLIEDEYTTGQIISIDGGWGIN